MAQIITMKREIIIPSDAEVEKASINVDAKQFIDEIDWDSILIMGMDNSGFINRLWRNMSYPDLIYHLERAKHNFMKDIDEVNE